MVKVIEYLEENVRRKRIKQGPAGDSSTSGHLFGHVSVKFNSTILYFDSFVQAVGLVSDIP